MNTRTTNIDEQLVPAGNDQVGEELAVSDSVVASVTDWSDAVTHFQVSVKSQAVHVTFDGSDPAAAGAGILLPANGLYIWNKTRLEAAMFIRAGASDATVRFEPLSEG